MLHTLCLDSSWHDFTFWFPFNLNFTLFPYRPRLGVTLHKVVMAGALYLLFSGMEGVLRVTGVSNNCLNFPTCHRHIGCMYLCEQLLSLPNNNQSKFPLLQFWRLCRGKCVWVVMLLDSLSASWDVDVSYSVFGIKYLTCHIFDTFPVFLWHCGSDSKLGPVHDWCLYYFVDILLKAAEYMTLFIAYYFCLVFERNERCFACFC